MTETPGLLDHPLAPAARTLAALRSAGAADIDLLALARLEATVHRGLRQDPAVQRWLAGRMAAALTALQARVQGAVRPAPAGPTPDGAALLRALRPDGGSGAGGGGGGGGELRSAQRLRPTLARLRVQRQIARAQARQPDNPGPLNSEHLLVRALQQMQTLAPAYLESFITQVETLLWLDSARGAGAPEPRATARPATGAGARPTARNSRGR